MPAEAVQDGVLVEHVVGQIRFAAQQRELAARHEPQQAAAARAQRTIAGQGLFYLALDLVGHLAAVAAATIFHGCSPVVSPWAAASSRRAPGANGRPPCETARGYA